MLRHIVLGSLSLTVLCAQAANPQFTKLQLTDQFWAEGAHFADFNKDGKMDITSGPFWYAGPDFKQRHEIWPATATFKVKKADGGEETIPGFEGGLGKKNAYSQDFLTFTYDFNQDGWMDVFVCGMPSEPAIWYANPGAKGGLWLGHSVHATLESESPALLNVVGDERPEILCVTDKRLGYVLPNWSDPTKPWKWVAITPQGSYHKYTHGLGAGDVNGDGRMDILEKDGWWEQPASLEGDPVWKFHKAQFGQGGAQMYAYDVNGDGLNDVITSIVAHGYGLSWFEQVRENGQSIFREHPILSKEPGEKLQNVQFSQVHAIDLVDMNGDGLKDLVSGKRFWAHGPEGDPEPNAPAVLYWFELRRSGGKAEYFAHLVDDNSGVGTQVVAADITGDKRPDILVGNKKGVFLFKNTAP